MTIQIILSDYIIDLSIWSCWLEITDSIDTWILPATAPGTLVENELQAYFDTQESKLWQIAQIKQYPVYRLGLKAKSEAKQFVLDNPNALQLIELAPDDLELAIENRTAGQETLLLKTLAFAIRFLYDEMKD